MEQKEIEQLKKQKDNAYWERNQLVAALSKLFPSHLAKHPEDDKEWEDDWRTIVVINIPIEKANLSTYEIERIKSENRFDNPSLQLSWHIHDTEIPMFDHLNYRDYRWDGHSTEEKYCRLRKLKVRESN
ncbi:MAG: hypothetical protein ACMUJM_08960 [bacterium]